MQVSRKDRDILKSLAEKKAEIAALPVQQIRKDLWTRMNKLERVKPMMWLNEVCWHEMALDGELEVLSEDPFLKVIEDGLRKELYQWNHMQGDMVVEPVIYSPLAIQNTGFGLIEDVDIAQTDEANSVVSRHYHIQIKDEKDAEKIKTPRINHDKEESDRRFDLLHSILDGIIPVHKRGIPGMWFSPWDELIRLTGVQEGLMDLAMRPEYMHVVLRRLFAAYNEMLDQIEEQGLLSPNNDNTRIGSGAYGYSDQLPADGYDPSHLTTKDIWGSATAQIFSEVSPAMHEEFSLNYERSWLDRFGLTYYGCCEPLHDKIGILKSVANLRKISMSPWVNVEKAVEQIGGDYVYSMKPSPAILAEGTWNPERARTELNEILEKTKTCCVEIIMKDISTVRYQPQRLMEWAGIADEVTAKFA